MTKGGSGMGVWKPKIPPRGSGAFRLRPPGEVATEARHPREAFGYSHRESLCSGGQSLVCVWEKGKSSGF